MIEVIAEHSVDIDLLPEKAKVLDLGCRGFLFTDELRRRGHIVLAVDMDKLDRKDYLQRAIGGELGRVGIKRTSDPQATCVMQGDEVDCLTLDVIISESKIEMFDLIKMDIEGSEYDVIMSLTKPPAKQLSIEFHLHTPGQGDYQVKLMVNKLEDLGYKAVQHEKTSQHGCGMNYWDTLFILQ
jgi:hypothetical protein